MRVGVDRTKYSIQIPLPPKIDPTVSLMTVEEKPDVTYDDVGGAKDALEKLREVLETPLLHPERFVTLGIDPPKGILLYGPPGTGKTLTARAVANRTDACFIRVIGSELVQKYVGEGARMVRELFTMARSKRACIVFFDEVSWLVWLMTLLLRASERDCISFSYVICLAMWKGALARLISNHLVTRCCLRSTGRCDRRRTEWRGRQRVRQ